MSKALSRAPRVMLRGINGFLCRAFKAMTELHDGDRRVAIAFLVLAQRPNGQSASGVTGSDQPVQISVHALAKSLAIPYETMRRSVAVLTDAGLCERTGRDAVALCRNQKTQAAIAHMRGAMVAEFLQLLRDLKSADFDFCQFVRASRPGQSVNRPTWDLAHAACMLFLRFVEVGSPLHRHDLSCTMVFTAIVSGNLAHLVRDRAMTWRYAAIETPPPDQLRRAVSVRAVSDMLGMPVETTRRCVCKLIDNGECTRLAGRGVIVPASVLQRKTILRLAALMATRLDQTLSELGRRGFDFEAGISNSH